MSLALSEQSWANGGATKQKLQYATEDFRPEGPAGQDRKFWVSRAEILFGDFEMEGKGKKDSKRKLKA